MQTAKWYKGRKKRVKKKYGLFKGRYLSPKEQKEFYKKYMRTERR